MKLKKIEFVEGAEEIENKLVELGLFKILMGRKNQYWCTIAHDHPEAVVVMSAAGGKKGFKTPKEALEAAFSLAEPRMHLLGDPDSWVS